MTQAGSLPVTDRTVEVDDAKLQNQAFGEPSRTPLLLIMGAMSSMLWWPERFCEALAARGRFVIRYDQRDTGLSTHYPLGRPGYTSDDLADDAVAILDAHGLRSAHLVGMSMGGIVAQEIALRHPERVRSLTLISSSPLGIEDLPSCTDSYSAHAATAEDVNWTDLDAVAEFLRRDAAMLAGTLHPHDAEAAEALIARDIARAPDFASATNHFILPSANDGASLHASQLKLPILAIHGTADPLFPIAHGAAFTRIAPDARLFRIEGGGHEIHDRDIEEIAAAIAEHTAR